METYNYKTKKWEEEKPITTDDIIKIVGKGVRVEVDSLGNIKINKSLTATQKQKIEAL